jgi:AcrR family transcriptional regulator
MNGGIQLGRVDAHPERPLQYTSVPILERRRRMLKETRKLLKEGGAENFSVAELCQRADVAERTVYNAFQGKDRLVAMAVRDAFDAAYGRARFAAPGDTFEGMLERAVRVQHLTLSAPSYSRAATTIYFASSTSADVWATLRGLALAAFDPWFSAARARGWFRRWLDLDHFATTLANAQYANVDECLSGRLTAEELIQRQRATILVLMSGALQGKPQTLAQDQLACLRPIEDGMRNPARQRDGKEAVVAEEQGAPPPRKRAAYFSPAIAARRRRILKEVRRLITDRGLEKFSMRELSRRAEVSPRTLYNAFGTRNGMIAIAIKESFEFYQSRAQREDGRSPELSDLLARTVAINRRNLQSKNYAKAICSLYFSSETPADIWQTLLNMAIIGNGEWLFRRRKELLPCVDLDNLAHAIANAQYSSINDWAVGRVGDDRYLVRLVETMLLLIVGAATGHLSEEAESYLAEIRRTGRLPQALRAQASTD